jgi:hypothetical protein
LQQARAAAQPVLVEVVVAVLVLVPVVVHTGWVQAVAFTQLERLDRQVMQGAPVALVTCAQQLVSQVVCPGGPQGHSIRQVM